MEQPAMDKPILVVDDEPEILMAVDTALRMAGFDNIVTINDSRDVIRHMEREIPALILLDLNMPHINGGRLLKIIRKTWPKIPVIVLTGTIEVHENRGHGLRGQTCGRRPADSGG
jgi:DNA-binding response OmpR family regulator